MLDKGANHIHVLHAVVKSLERLVVLDFFVLGKVGRSLILLHILEQDFEVVCINIVPKGLLPGLELAVNDGDKIPHLLELHELVLAVSKLLLLGPLQFEKLLEHLQILCFAFHGARLLVVLTNLQVGIVDDLRISVLDIVGKSSLELLSKLENLDLEVTNSLLDVVGLLGLERQDSFLYWAKGVVSGVFESSS